MEVIVKYLLTINGRGFLSPNASESQTGFFYSESGQATLCLSKLDIVELAKAIITKKSKITTADCTLIDLEFKAVGEVTLIWVAKSVFERATFNEANLLVALIEILVGE